MNTQHCIDHDNVSFEEVHPVPYIEYQIPWHLPLPFPSATPKAPFAPLGISEGREGPSKYTCGPYKPETLTTVVSAFFGTIHLRSLLIEGTQLSTLVGDPHEGVRLQILQTDTSNPS